MQLERDKNRTSTSDLRLWHCSYLISCPTSSFARLRVHTQRRYYERRKDFKHDEGKANALESIGFVLFAKNGRTSNKSDGSVEKEDV
jgi:hypothetical protein|mmetsp:Transcript_15646/g.33794  ORF Transcript_15646/g.33794 Transcript_15646/m.33794 type:complete len:87 (-) Transcript_15646:3081-3341(-)